ncbi:MAG: hypothetical protein H6719_36985 [Sandaracinaceae bacterium]|nr:hypothetical protein [Sandaracinaceae bacterium]
MNTHNDGLGGSAPSDGVTNEPGAMHIADADAGKQSAISGNEIPTPLPDDRIPVPPLSF